MEQAANVILWSRLDQPGHESAQLLFQSGHWNLKGTSVFAHAQQPCRLEYQVICDSEWQTIAAVVTGWVASRAVEVTLSADATRSWRLNGSECPDVTGSIDLDLNFSPSTNLLPIRRLKLQVGQEATVCAAWLRFPSFTLEPLQQLYRRTNVDTYHYEGAGGKFAAELQVNASGFVTLYPGFWQAEASV